MNKYVFYLVILVTLITTLLQSGAVSAQQSTTQRDSTYRDRLIDYADIYSYELDTNTRDTLLYVRKINDYWYGLFGTANVGLSFGNFKGLIDPNNDYNIFNTLINFYSKFGQGYTLGLIGEWIPNKSDWGLGLKLGLFDRKITNVASEDVEIQDFFGGEYDFSANITYFNVAPYVKYAFPFFDGFFLTGGVDLSLAYSTVALMERNYEYTGDIYHRISIDEVKGNTRFLMSLGAGYDFFIADFFSQNNRVRITPFAELKAGTKVISTGGSSWNDIVLNVGVQIKLAPDIVTIDTLIYDPNSDIPVEYFSDFHPDDGIEFAGLTPQMADPPSFNLSVIPPEPVVDTQFVAVTAPPKDTVPKVTVTATPRPPTTSTRLITVNDTTDIDGYATSTSTAITADIRRQLAPYVQFLKENPGMVIRLMGHSDASGSGAQNLQRARDRAAAMRNYLIGQGIARNRVYFEGNNAAFYPKAPNNTPQGRRRNRRVSVVVERGR